MIDEIKTWLKQHGRDREWLGLQLGVHKRTVDNWLSAGKAIPEAKLALIRRLMQDDEAEAATRRLALMPRSQIFSVEVDLSTYRAYNAASLAAGKTLEQWSIDELNAAAEQALAAQEAAPAPDPKKPNAA